MLNKMPTKKNMKKKIKHYITILHKKDLPFHEVRICRYCGKILLKNFFFCNMTCQENYMEEHFGLYFEDIQKRQAAELIEPEKELAFRCKHCKEKCKVYVEKGASLSSYSILCRKDKELVELEQRLLRRI